MRRGSVRVILASDSPRVTDFLGAVVESETGFEVVGQAQNVIKALALARNLRPDVAVIDSYLPYSVGMDNISLSRINGLDAAQAISEEIPGTRVILLNNLDIVAETARNLSSDTATAFSIEMRGENPLLAAASLSHAPEQPNGPILASVEAKPEAALQRKVTHISDIVIFFGALAFAGGWLITLTVVLAPVGVPLAALGATTVILGLAGKMFSSLWRKLRSRTKG